MNVYVVTVTYGNRSQFVEKLVERVLAIGVAKVVIVDNNSVEESKINLRRLASALATKVELISLSENLGSAGGFKAGLLFAESQNACDFIWMLDDDNLPETNALNALLTDYDTLGENCCLVSLRKDRASYRKIHNLMDVKRKFRPYNSFSNYNIIHGFRKKILYSLTRKKLDIIPIPYGPYGGMFFHKKLLAIIGYPLEKMFLYMDDHEFSHRIIRANLSIYLSRRSRVGDMEASWHATKKYRIFKRFRMIIDGDETKTYFLTRNLIFFERKYFVRNRFEYAVNRFVYKLIFYSLCIILNKRDRISFLRRAEAESKVLDKES